MTLCTTHFNKCTLQMNNAKISKQDSIQNLDFDWAHVHFHVLRTSPNGPQFLFCLAFVFQLLFNLPEYQKAFPVF